MHLFRVTLILLVIVFDYSFPIDSLTLSLSDLSVSGLLVVPDLIFKILRSSPGRNPLL